MGLVALVGPLVWEALHQRNLERWRAFERRHAALLYELEPIARAWAGLGLAFREAGLTAHQFGNALDFRPPRRDRLNVSASRGCAHAPGRVPRDAGRSNEGSTP